MHISSHYRSKNGLLSGGALLMLLSTAALFSTAASACDSEQQRAALYALESQKLLEHGPSFRHGWEDKAITLSIENPANAAAQACKAELLVQIPQQDLDEVNRYLDQNPAKRILLGAQGYSVPASNSIRVETAYRLSNTGDITLTDSPDRAYKDMHNSLEFMYQLLAQLRTEVTASSHNTQAWPATLLTEERKQCAVTLKAQDIAAACACRTDALATKISPRQMELVHTLLQQPYSTATGALISYTTFSKQVNQQCGLQKP
ncbi:hypothetical protein [Methylobacillus flagellatus]|uniref:hypothetical protein n=1 Tax=Methylobacillus flagellatus TaxID=405 RepID=UPI0010F6BC95|nr:hypothetical protein [Methylobacillus flagellatus]